MKTNSTPMLTRLLAGFSLCVLPVVGLSAAPDTRAFEMRIYYAAEGKLDALNARFRDHTLKLFEKHGMQNLGYWMPVNNPSNKLVYILAHKSRDAAKESWKNFGADPEWKEVVKKTEAGGRLVTRVESLYLGATDYSPEIKPAVAAPRVFELRTYTAAEGRLDALNARFRDHTVALFRKHGIQSLGYWVPLDKAKGADNTLVYILSHPSQDEAQKAFGTFRADPDWVAARKASEDKAGGPLTVKDGVKSEFMAATDYSPMR